MDKPDAPDLQGPFSVDLDNWPDDKPRSVTDINLLPSAGQHITSQIAPFNLDVDGTTRVKGDLVIETDTGEEIDVGEFIKNIGERLCVLQPNLEAHENYPALKDAYDKYKMLEKLLVNSNVKKD